MSFATHSSLTDLTQCSACEFKFGLLAGKRIGFTLPDSIGIRRVSGVNRRHAPKNNANRTQSLVARESGGRTRTHQGGDRLVSDPSTNPHDALTAC